MGNPVQQQAVIVQDLTEVASDEIWVPHWSAQDLDPLPVGCHVRSAPNHCSRIHNSRCPLQNVAHHRSHPTLVPDLRLTDVNVNSSVRPQRFLEDGVDRSYPVKLREEVHIIQKSEEAFPWVQESVSNASCCPRENNNGINASPCGQCGARHQNHPPRGVPTIGRRTS